MTKKFSTSKKNIFLLRENVEKKSRPTEKFSVGRDFFQHFPSIFFFSKSIFFWSYIFYIFYISEIILGIDFR